MHPQKKRAKSNSLATYSSFINTISSSPSSHIAEVRVSLDQQKPAQDELITCPNESCKKAFTKPLKALNLQASSEVYDACPHCLTKVSSTDKKTASHNEVNLEILETKSLCFHYLGYLCDRPEKDKLPDECIICKNVVTCMLKGLKEQLPQESSGESLKQG